MAQSDTRPAGTSIDIEGIKAHLDGTLRILVADDSPEVLDVLSLFLEKCSLFEVDKCHSIEEARAGLERGRHETGIVDLYMPGPSGASTESLVRQYSERLPIVMISGKATGGDGFNYSRLNVVGFLDKESLDQSTLTRIVFDASVRRKLSGVYPSPLFDAKLQSAFESLFDRNPETVADWAALLNVSTRALEYAFHPGTYSPNTVLVLYKLYRAVYLECMTGTTGLASLPQRDRGLIEYYSAFNSKLREMLDQAVAAPAN